jgi:ATP-dependent Clp protease ATP-binding subunit ClpA
MYPFERFTERAKKVLTFAQEEAERSHHSYIGTEHLLIGILREGDGLGAKVLANLAIELGSVREAIETVLGHNERIIIQQIVPTSRVKKVIEISFEEARRMGHNYVGTEHLLLGLLIEGEGIAAHVLQDLGATLDKVRAEIDRLLLHGTAEEVAPGARQAPARLSDEASLALRLAGEIAAAEGAKETTSQHLKRALAALDTKAGTSLLQLTSEIRVLEARKQEAIQRQDFEAAARARDEQLRLRREFAQAEEAVKRSLKRGRKAGGSN